jgi:hypothetical protein
MRIVLKIKRAETPFHTAPKRFALSIIHFDLPFRRWWGVFLWAKYVSVDFVLGCFRRLIAVAYYGPLFKSHWVSYGGNLYLELVPVISGPFQIFVGNRICISGLRRMEADMYLTSSASGTEVVGDMTGKNG